MMKGMDDRNGAKVVKADVPLSEMFGYVTKLRTILQVEQLQQWNFHITAEAPRNVAEEVCSKS